jgi:hypothetical protein
LHGIDDTGVVSGKRCLLLSLNSTESLGSTVINDTYVNFFWADYDPSNNFVYVLAGDENNAITLPAVLYIFDVANQVTRFVRTFIIYENLFRKDLKIWLIILAGFK